MGGQTGAQFGGGPVPGAPGGGLGGAPGFSPAGQGGVEERLAMLKQLHDRGVLTESEYQAKRQQIIDGL